MGRAADVYSGGRIDMKAVHIGLRQRRSPALASSFFDPDMPAEWRVAFLLNEQDALWVAGDDPDVDTVLAELADADVYFHVGLPFEQRLIGKLASLAPDARRVNLREHVDLLPMSASCGHCHEHGHGSSHSQGGAYDPHVWLSPARMKTMVGVMASTLTNMSPSRASEIVAAETTLRARLDRLDATLRAALDNVTNNAFLVFHSAWRYFAHDYGLHEISIQMEGKEPTARELEATLASAKKHGVTILVTQPQFSDRLARMVARETGTRCVEVDPLSPDYAGTLTNFARVLAGEE